MSGITAAGIGSGLDLEALIEVTIEATRVPQEARLQSRRDTLDVTLSAVGAIQSAMSSFREILEKAKEPTTFFPRTAFVAGSDVESEGYSGPFGVTVKDEATNGSYDVEVLSLASGSRVATQTEYASSSTVIANTAGELTFAAGSGADEETFTVEVTAGMTLSELREAVNDAGENFGVSANLINTGSGTQLVFDSSKSGADDDTDLANGNPNDLRIISSGVANGDLDALIGNTQVTQSASEARISVNGIEATSNTNTFSDVISGVTIDVNSLTSSSTTLEIKPDDDAAVESVRSFVDAYNKIISEIDKYSKPDQVLEGEDSDRKELSGDAMFRSMKYSLGKMTTNGYEDPSQPGRITTFYALGIEMDDSGQLTLDETKLQDWVEGDLDKLGEIFAGDGGVVDTFYDYTKSFEQSGGVLASREDTTRSQLKDLDYADLALKERMAEYESTLRAKYTAFDQTMGALNSQMSYIMAQLG
ncbi:flagellar filament capping protein FliD [Agarivorans aestuarii]|uniref:Flagellar hook-associated protein 2 n=1 Tax=Agarivorans aestuarii TaxID=1563703 RepID=A0ABU7G0E2_9ALTE|nr:flagellar filament capping protein FliD [Agarivorans aestuarii]MEE1672888.1 flagellar filament capping protein FliD [Agarivorans aestuarii]